MSDREKRERTAEEWAQAGAESPDDADAGNRTSRSRTAGWARDTARSPDDAEGGDTAADKPAPGGRR